MATNLQGSSYRPRAVGFRLRNRKDFIYEWMEEKRNGDPMGCPNEKEIFYTEYTQEDLEDDE